MGIFRCIADEVTNPVPQCVLGGQPCEEANSNAGVADGVDITGVTRLRTVSYPMPNAPTLSPSATSEDAYGDASEWRTDTWKRLVVNNLSTFLMAGCRTRAVDIPPGGKAQDIWSCAGVPEAGFDPANPGEPANRPNDGWATCRYIVEGGSPEYLDLQCIPYSTLYNDVPVTLRTDAEFNRLVSVHDGYCVGFLNRRCIGLPWINGVENQSPLTTHPAWHRIGVQLHAPRLRWNGTQTPLANRAWIDLSNRVLGYLPGPGWFNLGMLVNVLNNDPRWSLNTSDVWRAGFDALAPGGAGCAALPAIMTFNGRTLAGDCPAIVQWVPLRASYAMSMSLYGIHRGNVSSEVWPAIQFHIDVEMGCRYIMGPCTVIGPGGPVSSQPAQQCARSLYELTVPGDRVVLDYQGAKLYDLPRYVRWRGEVGPNLSGGSGGTVSATSGDWRPVANVGGVSEVCCPSLRGLEGQNIPAKRYNPTGGIEPYQGSVSIYPNADGEVDARGCQ